MSGNTQNKDQSLYMSLYVLNPQMSQQAVRGLPSVKAGSNLKLLSADLKFSSFVAINCRKCPVSDTLSKSFEQLDNKLEEATKKHLDTGATPEEKFNKLATITASLNGAPETAISMTPSSQLGSLH